jgi:hypothetical protein
LFGFVVDCVWFYGGFCLDLWWILFCVGFCFVLGFILCWILFCVGFCFVLDFEGGGGKKGEGISYK